MPVSYSHVVLTVPEQLAPLAPRNQRLFCSMLFRASSETLLEIAADPRRLDARIGIVAVLHTQRQNLQDPLHQPKALIRANTTRIASSGWIVGKREISATYPHPKHAAKILT